MELLETSVDRSELANRWHAVVGLDPGCLGLLVLRDGERAEDDPLLGRAYWGLYR